MSHCHRLCCFLAALIALTAPAQGSDFKVKPGSIIAVDSVAPNHHAGPFRLVQYDAAGNILDLLTLIDPYGIGIPTGVALLGGDVFVTGTSRGVAQVDLETGVLINGFFHSMPGSEGLGELDGNLVVCTWRHNTAGIFNREGVLQQSVEFSPYSEIAGIDSDGTHWFTCSWIDGDIDVYDLAGTFMHSIPTGIGPASASDLSYDRATDTLWVTTGFGSDEVRQYDLAGTLLHSFPAGLPFLNGVDRSDEALILNAEPNFAIGGDTLKFEIYDGPAGNPLMHVISSISGAPVLLPLFLGAFAADGTFAWQTDLPPGLAPLVIGHRAYALDAGGKLVVSNEELVFHH